MHPAYGEIASFSARLRLQPKRVAPKRIQATRSKSLFMRVVVAAPAAATCISLPGLETV